MNIRIIDKKTIEVMSEGSCRYVLVYVDEYDDLQVNTTPTEFRRAYSGVKKE